jgi:hypothetical protein
MRLWKDPFPISTSILRCTRLGLVVALRGMACTSAPENVTECMTGLRHAFFSFYSRSLRGDRPSAMVSNWTAPSTY